MTVVNHENTAVDAAASTAPNEAAAPVIEVSDVWKLHKLGGTRWSKPSSPPICGSCPVSSSA